MSNVNKPRSLQRTATFESLSPQMKSVGSEGPALAGPSSHTPPAEPATARNRFGQPIPPGRELIRTTRSLLLPPLPPASSGRPSNHITTRLPYVVSHTPSSPGDQDENEDAHSEADTEPLGYDPNAPTQDEWVERVKSLGIKIRDFAYERSVTVDRKGKGKAREDGPMDVDAPEPSPSRKRARADSEARDEDARDARVQASRSTNGTSDRPPSTPTEPARNSQDIPSISPAYEGGSPLKRRKVMTTPHQDHQTAAASPSASKGSSEFRVLQPTKPSARREAPPLTPSELFEQHGAKVRDFAYEDHRRSPETWFAKDDVLQYHSYMHDKQRVREGHPLQIRPPTIGLPGKLMWRLVDSGLIDLEVERRRWDKWDLISYEDYLKREGGPYPYRLVWAEAPNNSFTAMVLGKRTRDPDEQREGREERLEGDEIPAKRRRVSLKWLQTLGLGHLQAGEAELERGRTRFREE